MKKLILLNGPKRVGKDTAAHFLLGMIPNSVRIGFADELKIRTHAAYCMPSVPFDYFESCKDEENDAFYGVTPRAAYIAFSEQFYKPLHGKNIFGSIWQEKFEASGAEVALVPDSGFVEEAEYQRKYFGSENIFLVRLYRDGFTFEGDSRNYIDLPDVTKIHVHNNETLAEYRQKLIQVATIIQMGLPL